MSAQNEPTDAELVEGMTVPTQEQIVRAAKLTAVAMGDSVDRWPSHAGVATVALVVMMNETKVIKGI